MFFLFGGPLRLILVVELRSGRISNLEVPKKCTRAACCRIPWHDRRAYGFRHRFWRRKKKNRSSRAFQKATMFVGATIGRSTGLRPGFYPS